MARTLKHTGKAKQVAPVAGYDVLLADIASVLEAARRAAARSVNAHMTATYWSIGKRIVEQEQNGLRRAEYGERLIAKLGADLTARFGRGFSARNLAQMRSFYVAWPILQKSPAKLAGSAGDGKEILQTVSAKSLAGAPAFALPWSHYTRLLKVKNQDGRLFYEAEALRGGWTLAQLDRQIQSQFYERTMLSKNKSGMLRRNSDPKLEDLVTAEQEIKDPYVLEFLALKDEYSESDLESALILQLESFLLELGGDFAFIGRQRRLRIGDEWYRVDLLFFHRRLRCLVVVDLKLGKFTHADAGQMHLYLNYAREHWSMPDENPPVGLILCAEKDRDVAKYALDGLPNKVLAAEYRMALPDEKRLIEAIGKTRRELEARRSGR